MPELFQKMYYGPNVQNLVESDDCKVMRLSDNSGEGMMTLYHVFPGVFLMYNDFHMKECVSGFQTDMDLLCIDHCREGRIEQEVGQNAFSYLETGDLRVDRRIHHSGKVEFPLCHYHGISIGFQMETAAKEIPASMKGFSVDLYELQKKYCSDRTPYVIPGEPAIEHIFSELYNVPVKIKKDYFKIKVLELLLYLDALELSGHTEERPYFYKGQVEKIKAIIAAAKAARCHDFIMALPDGYDTVIGEGGSSLSGGEKQRISIARAMLKDAPIIILDEATASIDPENEHLIQEAISALTHGKTIITIAHRLATIENADQILVIDGGTVAQRGTHKELLQQEGTYKKFIQIREQAEGWRIQ